MKAPTPNVHTADHLDRKRNRTGGQASAVKDRNLRLMHANVSTAIKSRRQLQAQLGKL